MGVARIVDVAWEARQSSLAYTTQEVTAIFRVDRACNTAGVYLLHLEPMAALPVGLQGGLKGLACEGAVRVTMLRVGSFLLAAAGKTRKVHAAPFGVVGRESFALNLMGAVDLTVGER